MFFVATYFVLVFLGNIHVEANKIDRRSVNVALETVLAFNGKEKPQNVQLLKNVQNFISKVREKVENKPKGKSIKDKRRRFGWQPNPTFTDFIQELIDVLKSFRDEDLQDVFAIADDEIGKYHYKGCKFQELISDHNIRSFITQQLEYVKRQPADVIRENLDKFVLLLTRRFDTTNLNIINYINSMYTKDDIEDFKDIIENFKTYKREDKNTNKLILLVRNTVRRTLFDHYSSLNINTRRALKAKLEALLWNDPNNPDKVKHLERTIEYIKPTNDAPNVLRELTTKKYVPKKRDFDNQFDFEFVEENYNKKYYDKKDKINPNIYDNSQRADKQGYDYKSKIDSEDLESREKDDRKIEHLLDTIGNNKEFTPKKYEINNPKLLVKSKKVQKHIYNSKSKIDSYDSENGLDTIGLSEEDDKTDKKNPKIYVVSKGAEITNSDYRSKIESDDSESRDHTIGISVDEHSYDFTTKKAKENHTPKTPINDYKSKIDSDTSIGVDVGDDFKTEKLSDSGGINRDFTRKIPDKKIKFKHATPFTRNSNIGGSSNGNIGRPYNNKKQALREFLSFDPDTKNNFVKNVHNSYKNKKEKFIPKTRDLGSQEGGNQKFSMHSYLKTVNFDGEELTLKLTQSKTDSDDQKQLRSKKIITKQDKKSQEALFSQTPSTKMLYNITERNKPTTNSEYSESTDEYSDEINDSSYNKAIIQKAHETTENVSTSLKSEQDKNDKKSKTVSLKQTTKNLYVSKDQEETVEESEDEESSIDFNSKSLQTTTKIYTKIPTLQKSYDTMDGENSSSSESEHETSETQQTFHTSKQDKPVENSLDENSSSNSSESSKESTQKAMEPIIQRAREINYDTSTDSSLEQESKMQDEYKILQTDNRSNTKKLLDLNIIQATKNMYTTNKPDIVGEFSDKNTIKTNAPKTQKAFTEQSTSKGVLSAETKNESGANLQEIPMESSIESDKEFVEYTIDTTTKNILMKAEDDTSAEHVNPKFNKKSSGESQSSIENKPPTYYSSPDIVERVSVVTKTLKESVEKSEEEEEYTPKDTTVAQTNQFEPSMNQQFIQDWVKKTVEEQALRNQELQANIEKYRSRKRNKEKKTPISEQPAIKKTKIFNYGEITDDFLHKKMMELVRKRDQFANIDNDPFMLQNLSVEKNLTEYTEQNSDANDIKENAFRRSIKSYYENHKAIDQEKTTISETSTIKLISEVIKSGPRNMTEAEYINGSSAELVKSVSAMKNNLIKNKHLQHNENIFISTELKGSANKIIKSESRNKDDSLPFDYKAEKYTPTMKYTTTANYEVITSKSTESNTLPTVDNYSHYKRIVFRKALQNSQEQHNQNQNLEEKLPIIPDLINNMEKSEETKSVHESFETTLKIQKALDTTQIMKMNTTGIKDKIVQNFINQSLEANITEKENVRNVTSTSLMTYKTAKSTNTSGTMNNNKTTISYIMLSDFLGSQPFKMNLDTIPNEIIELEKTQNKNQNFRRRKRGNREKMKQLQEMYKTIYPIKVTSPKTSPTSTSKLTTVISTTSSLTTTQKPTMITEFKEPSTEATTVTSTEKLSTISENPVQPTKKTRRRKKRRRKKSTTISTSPEPSTIFTEATTTTIITTDVTKTNTEIKTIAEMIEELTLANTEPTSTSEIAETTKASNIISEITRERSENSKTALTEVAKQFTESTTTFIEPEIMETLPEPTQTISDKTEAATEFIETSTERSETTIIPIIKDNTLELRRSISPIPAELGAQSANFTNLLDNDLSDVAYYHEIARKNQSNIDQYDTPTNLTNKEDDDLEKFNIKDDGKEFSLKEAIALADAIKPPQNIETELKIEKARMVMNRDIMKLYGHTVTHLTPISTVPSNTLFTDPFDPLMANDIIGLDFL